MLNLSTQSKLRAFLRRGLRSSSGVTWLWSTVGATDEERPRVPVIATA